MAGAETARTLTFSVRKMVIQPLNNANLLGVPVTLDTVESVDLKFDVTMEMIRGGAYLLPLGIDPKEMKIELTGKLTDCPPSMFQFSLLGTYAKVTAAGPVLDSDGVVNMLGTSVGTRCSVSAASPAVNGRYTIQATAAQSYQVYDWSTGKAATAVTTQLSSSTTDTASVSGVTITTAAGTFTANDVGNFEIINPGQSGATDGPLAETIAGATSYPVTPPQAQILADATRRGVMYQFLLYYCITEGIGVPLGQGKYAVPDFKAQVQVPPYGAASQVPYRYRRVA